MTTGPAAAAAGGSHWRAASWLAVCGSMRIRCVVSAVYSDQINQVGRYVCGMMKANGHRSDE